MYNFASEGNPDIKAKINKYINKKVMQTGFIYNTWSLTDRCMYRLTNIETVRQQVRQEDTERAAGTHVTT